MTKEIKSVIFITILMGNILHAGTIFETFDWATVGDVGNGGYANKAGAGKVDYVYQINKYETTISQYASFLNSVATFSDPYQLWKTQMNPSISTRGIIKSVNTDGSFNYIVKGDGNKPVEVNWFDAARFCNWMQNGGTSLSSTETGSYELNGAITGIIYKNSTATFALPTLSEWFKAAYYDPNKNGLNQGGYWTYANQSDIATTDRINYGQSHPDVAGDLVTAVGFFTDATSYYGTYDQSGNVTEWNDQVAHAANYRGRQGGAFDSTTATGDLGKDSIYNDGYFESPGYTPAGFRIAMVPEPSALALFAVSLGGLAMMRRRRS